MKKELLLVITKPDKKMVIIKYKIQINIMQLVILLLFINKTKELNYYLLKNIKIKV